MLGGQPSPLPQPNLGGELSRRHFFPPGKPYPLGNDRAKTSGYSNSVRRYG